MNREQWQVKQYRYQTHPLAGVSAPASHQTLAARAGPSPGGPHTPAPAGRPPDTAFPA